MRNVPASRPLRSMPKSHHSSRKPPAAIRRECIPGGGAIFFNRIGELSLAAQRKLVDLLQKFAIAAPDHRRRDAIDHSNRKAIPDLRLLAASTRPLAAMVAARELLPELHGLFDATLTILPLRARRRDLPLLVHHYLGALNPSLTLSAAALRALSAYPFPGNVLELINFVTRVAITSPQAASRSSVIGNSATGRSATSIVGRAEIISQLNRGSLNAVWRSRQHWDAGPKHPRRDISQPRVEAAFGDEPAPAESPHFAQPTLAPVALRLTAMPRLRKPRGGHHRPA